MKMQPRTRNLALTPVLATVLFLSAFTGAVDLAESKGLNLISLDQEWGMRHDLHAQVSRAARLVNDRSALAYLNTVGRRIAAQTPMGNRPWDFFIVQDSSLNAFNLPGGLVYVNSGLIAEAESLDQLAGVLAHEIGHGAARHGTQLMTRSYGYGLLANLVLGKNPGQGKQILAQLVGTGIITNYSREAERDADRLGVNYTYRAGYDPRGMLEFFNKMGSLRQRQPSKVEQFFASHPQTNERISIVQSEISRLPRKASLTRDTRNYQQFRSRFR